MAKVTDEKHTGDVARFETDFAIDVQLGRLHAISWNDLLLDATTLTHLKKEAHRLIEHYLGYLPSDTAILPFEPYLRALIQSYRQSQLTQYDYCHQLEEHIKLIRNKDMESTYNTYVTDDKTIYKNYEETFIPFGQVAKSRLMGFLGYEPKLEHSVVAEMWLRHMIANDTIDLPDAMTSIDQKAAAMIKYREILLESGRAIADSSPLFRLTVSQQL
ncbi:hypothetical protein [Larkinella rosea]|uniref:Uncharacterized protein n=1 Tax=Larkinella rosea TaxID=2025312 RepID=A0A3P1BC16_9BACT|nr:hypothetical protein [Larkinella rosea]RRA98610.1 hypothetical protein EHT25_26760 [Larkinella rosea]